MKSLPEVLSLGAIATIGTIELLSPGSAYAQYVQTAGTSNLQTTLQQIDLSYSQLGNDFAFALSTIGNNTSASVSKTTFTGFDNIPTTNENSTASTYKSVWNYGNYTTTNPNGYTW